MENHNPIRVLDWEGLITNVDPRDIPSGSAQVCDNALVYKLGVLQCRKGIQQESTLTAASPTAYDIVSMYNYQQAIADLLITEDTNGVVRKRTGSAATSLGTGYSTHWPMSFYRGRTGDLYGVNGMDRGIRWNGQDTALEQLGMTPPTAAPVVTSTPGSGALTYTMAYRYIDDTTPTGIASNVSAHKSLATASADDQFIWTTLASSDTRAYAVELYRSLQNNSDTLFLVGTYRHNGTITSSDETGVNIEFTVPTGHGVLTSQKITVAGSSEASDNVEHTVVSVTATTILTSTTHVADGTGGTWTMTGFVDDDDTDTQLSDNTPLPVTNADGTANSLQHSLPPTWATVMVQFQDRMVYGVPLIYREGTVATNGTTTVTGTGTAWTTDMAGRYIYITGEAPLEVSSVASATSMTLSVAAVTTASGTSYGITVSPIKRNLLAISQIDLPESVPSQNELIIQTNHEDEDEMTGLIPFGTALYACKERHIYKVTWVRQPQYDAGISPHVYRGLVNQRSWVSFEDIVYGLDQKGIWAMTKNGAIKHLSQEIQNLWRDGTLKFSDTKYWFATVDNEQHRIRWHVNYTTDSDTLPQRWIEYDVRASRWTTGTSEMGGFGAGCVLPFSGRARTVLGGQNDRVYLSNQGTTDGVSSQTRGTATAGASTTITDSGASFGTSSELDQVSVAIVAGTGAGQIRKIASHTATVLTVSAAWATNPSTDSVYLVGAIQWTWRSKLFRFGEIEEDTFRTLSLAYKPTATAANIHMKRYMNNDTTAEANSEIDHNQYGGLLTTTGGLDFKELNIIDQNNVPGYVQMPWTGNSVLSAFGDRWWAVELTGFQGDDSIEIYSLDLVGVEGK